MFLQGSSPPGNYVCKKSPERKFSLAGISGGILSGGNYLWGDCLGAIIQGAIVGEGGNFPRGNCPWSNYPGGSFSRWQLSSGDSCLGAIMWGATVRKAIIRGTNFLGDNCPDTISNITDMGKISIICNTSDITGIINTAQKMKFSIENFFSKYDQIYRPADLVTFTQEILNGKFHFLYSAVLMTLPILKTLLIFRRKFSNVGKTSYINNVSNVVKLSDIWVLKWIREL